MRNAHHGRLQWLLLLAVLGFLFQPGELSGRQRGKPAQTPSRDNTALMPFEREPSEPVVDFSEGQLRITAQNATMGSILRAVQRVTGIQMEGILPGSLDRMFGHFGPGPVPAVLSALLSGSRYDFIIVGDAGRWHVPSRVLLSPRDSRPADDIAPVVVSEQQEQTAEVMPETLPAQPVEPVAAPLVWQEVPASDNNVSSPVGRAPLLLPSAAEPSLPVYNPVSDSEPQPGSLQPYCGGSSSDPSQVRGPIPLHCGANYAPRP